MSQTQPATAKRQGKSKSGEDYSLEVTIGTIKVNGQTVSTTDSSEAFAQGLADVLEGKTTPVKGAK